VAQLYPVFLDLTGRRVLIVGGGNVAQRKVAQLLPAQAHIVLVSPDATDQIIQWAQNGQIEWLQRPFLPGDTRNAWLVVASSDQPPVNRAVRQEADQQGIFCNVVDVPALCTFQAPAVMRQGPLAIAISTAGASPALASRIRKDLEKQYGPCYRTLLAALARLRTTLKAQYPHDPQKRQTLLEGFLQSPALQLLQQNDQQAFDALLDEWLKA